MSDVSLDIGIQTGDLNKVIKQLEDLNKKLDGTGKTSKSAADGVKVLEANASKASKSAGGAFDGITNAVKGVDKAIKSLPLIGLIASIAALTAGVGGLMKGFSETSKALDVQNQSIQRMSLAISKNTKLTQDTNKSMMDFAGQLQKTTAYGDEFTMGLIATGAAAGRSGEEIQRLTKISLYLATATGINAEEAMKNLSVGMDDAAKSIAVAEQAGIGFTASEKKMIQELNNAGKAAEATAMVLDKMEKAVGGSAQKEVETFAGKQKQLANVMGDIKEEFGRVSQALQQPFLDAASAATQKFYDILNNPQVIDVIQKITTGFNLLGQVVGFVAKVAFTPIEAVLRYLVTGITGTIKNIQNFANTFLQMGDNVGMSMDKLQEIVIMGLGVIVNNFDSARNAIMSTAEGIGKALTLDFSGAKASFESVGQSVKDIFDVDAIKAKGQAVVDSIKKTHEDVKKKWEAPIEKPKIGLDAKEEAAAVKSFENPYRKALDLSNKTLPQLTAMQKKYSADIEKIDKDIINAKSAEELKGLENTKKILADELKQVETQANKIKNSRKDIFGGITSGANAAMGSISSLMGVFGSGIEEQAIALESYDAAIQNVTDKWTALQEARASEQEVVNTGSAAQIEWLDKQALTQDAVGKRAIALKKQQVKSAMDEEKKEAEEKKRISEEEKALEKQKNFEIAMAQYAKDKAVHENAVANMETQGKATVSQAVADGAMGVAKGALGVASSFATGGIIGGIIGLAMLPGIIAPIMSAIGQVKASGQALETLKGQAPKPPKFQYGTAGYSLGEGEQAIVGEAGAEVVSNKGGQLAVQSAYQTAQNGEGGAGGGITNITINASQYTMEEMKELVYDVLSNFKGREVVNAQ